MSLKTHLDILRMHEPVQHRARFWSSYVRALKGTEDMRASDDYRSPRSRSHYPRLFPDIPEYRSIDTDFYKPFYDVDPANRISTPGYRYDPVSRETYGYGPRPTVDSYRPYRSGTLY